MSKIGLPAYGLGRMDYLRGKLKGRSQDRYLQGGGSQEGRYQAMSVHIHEKAQAKLATPVTRHCNSIVVDQSVDRILAKQYITINEQVITVYLTKTAG